MKVLVQFTDESELKALPIILESAPGMMLPKRTYLLAEQTVRELRQAGVEFVELGRESMLPTAEGVVSCERI